MLNNANFYVGGVFLVNSNNTQIKLIFLINEAIKLLEILVVLFEFKQILPSN